MKTRLPLLKTCRRGSVLQTIEKTLVMADRKEAIKTASSLAEPKDIILVAGKGHETYQEIEGERFPLR